MELDKQSQFRTKKLKLLVAAVLLLAGSLSAWMIFGRGGQSFPALAHGAYVGQISGLGSDPSDSYTIYAESLSSTDALLIVVFKEGWNAQLVALKTQEIGTTAEKSKFKFQPIALNSEEQKLFLYGSASGAQFAGEVAKSLDPDPTPIGNWSLRPTSTSELRASKVSLANGFDFAAWLQAKGQHRKRAAELAVVSEEYAAEQQQLEQLNRLLEDETPLKNASAQYLQELEQEVEKLRTQEISHKKRILEFIRELDQLRRITKEGRSVELARRVVTRENKWYGVNWAKAEDFSRLEEGFAGSMEIDLRKLNDNYARTREVQRLKNQITREKVQVAKLQQQYQDKLKRSKEKKKDKDKSWWNWDNVFE